SRDDRSPGGGHHERQAASRRRRTTAAARRPRAAAAVLRRLHARGPPPALPGRADARGKRGRVTPTTRWEQRLAELREAFDRSFAEPFDAAPDAPAPSDRVLIATVGGIPYAVRLVDCTGAFRA